MPCKKRLTMPCCNAYWQAKMGGRLSGNQDRYWWSFQIINAAIVNRCIHCCWRPWQKDGRACWWWNSPFWAPCRKQRRRYALAAQRQGKYAEFHDALMRQGRLSEEFLQEAAANVGLDMTQMQTDLANGTLWDELANGTLWDELERNYKLAGLLNVQGTPALVANGKIARGALNEQALRQLLTEE